MRRLIFLSLLLCAPCAAHAEPPLKPLAPAIRLWEESAPLVKGEKEDDIPTITPYLLDELPDGKGRPCVIICPGGAYGSLAMREGDYYAHWLNELGVSAFVLKYRLGTKGYRHPAMLYDVTRAMRFVRANARTYGVDPDRIGIAGSSAGGHLASTLLTHFDAGDPLAKDPVERVSSRPDFGILVYPVISMQDGLTHAKSRRRLLGDPADPALVASLSNETQVKTDTPPVFLTHSMRDTGVPARNSMEFAAALSAQGVPFELHIYDLGDHGFALGTGDEWAPQRRHPWVKACEGWLLRMGFCLPSE